MRGGDISNEGAPIIGMRLERVIKTEEGKLNKAAKGYLQQAMMLDCNVWIITTNDKRKAMSFLMKWGIPYNYVVEAIESEIPAVCWENELLTYYDIDEHILQNVRSRGKNRTKAELWTSVSVS